MQEMMLTRVLASVQSSGSSVPTGPPKDDRAPLDRLVETALRRVGTTRLWFDMTKFSTKNREKLRGLAHTNKASVSILNNGGTPVSLTSGLEPETAVTGSTVPAEICEGYLFFLSKAGEEVSRPDPLLSMDQLAELLRFWNAVQEAGGPHATFAQRMQFAVKFHEKYAAQLGHGNWCNLMDTSAMLIQECFNGGVAGPAHRSRNSGSAGEGSGRSTQTTPKRKSKTKWCFGYSDPDKVCSKPDDCS